MRKWLYIYLLVLLSMLSCVGQKDDPAAEVRLVADLTALNVTAGEKTTFTVFSGAEDVTEFALIRNVTEGTALEGNVFAPDGEGEWTFVAEIDGAQSEPVTVTALVIAEQGKEFYRRSLVLDFTGTWCVNCPKMEAAITETMEARPGRVVPVSVHCMAVDPMYKSFSDGLVSQFGVKAYPSAVVDMDPASLITTASPELLQSQIDRLLEARGPAAGIRVSTLWIDAPGTGAGDPLQIEAELQAVREGSYTLGFAVLEDGIVAAQTGGTADYVHNHVLRHWKVAQTTSLSQLKEGETLKLYILYEVTKNQRIVAMAIRDGIVENITTCAAGSSVDYQYEEDNQ